ncbi:MAG TPA: gamma carbonic anhydrase family protein [Rhodanobacteraceae bacterium]|nr:gamma carbonic anhydrase family protein [Rhodanobacteraceae bacterium]
MSNIRSFHGFQPEVSPTAYVDPAAHVIGHVAIGHDSSIWPAAVVRGDMHKIRIGERTNIQDGALLHVTHDTQYTLGGFALTVGSDVTIGHGAALHGCTVQDACLIGMHATILDGTLIKRHALIGAGAVVAQGRVVGEGELWVGNPARCVRLLNSEEIQQIYYAARQYVRLKSQYQTPSRSSAMPALPEFDRRAIAAGM